LLLSLAVSPSSVVAPGACLRYYGGFFFFFLTFFFFFFFPGGLRPRPPLSLERSALGPVVVWVGVSSPSLLGFSTSSSRRSSFPIGSSASHLLSLRSLFSVSFLLLLLFLFTPEYRSSLPFTSGAGPSPLFGGPRFNIGPVGARPPVASGWLFPVFGRPFIGFGVRRSPPPLTFVPGPAFSSVPRRCFLFALSSLAEYRPSLSASARVVFLFPLGFLASVRLSLVFVGLYSRFPLSFPLPLVLPPFSGVLVGSGPCSGFHTSFWLLALVRSAGATFLVFRSRRPYFSHLARTSTPGSLVLLHLPLSFRSTFSSRVSLFFSLSVSRCP